MPVTFDEPVGGLLRAQQLLRLTLANCTQFQQICGVSDEAGALARIYINGLPKPANRSGYTAAEYIDYRPYAIIYTNYPHGYRMRMVATNCFDDSGSLVIEIQENVSEEMRDVIDEPMAEFEQRLGNILSMESPNKGFDGLFQVPGYLAGNDATVQFAERADVVHIPNYGDFLAASIMVNWGIR